MKNIFTKIVALTVVGFILFRPYAVYADTLEDFYHPTIPTNDEINPITTTAWVAQMFTATASYTLTSVRVYLRGGDGSTTVITASIRATSGGKPTGSDLGSGTSSGSISTGVYTPNSPFTIPISGSISIVSGTQYAIILKSNITTQAVTESQDGGTYTGGNDYKSSDSGANWTQFLDPNPGQIWFEVNGNPIASGPSNWGFLSFFGDW